MGEGGGALISCWHHCIHVEGLAELLKTVVTIKPKTEYY